jgi:hypothetical protein
LKTNAVRLPTAKRSLDEAFNETAFPHGLLEIERFKLPILDLTGNDKKIIIEIHRYQGFAMVKFFPFHLKKNPRRYELRGKELGYSLSSGTILHIIHECTLIMRDYLDVNPDEFVGYVGQKDSKDNLRKREQTQRCSIYNIFTSSVFKEQHKYKLSSKKKFKEINLRLIRVNKAKQPGKLTKKQMENYKSFLTSFEKYPKVHYDLMTDVTKEKVIRELEARNAN